MTCGAEDPITGVPCTKPLMHPGNDHRHEGEDFEFTWRETPELIVIEEKK